LFKIKDKYLYEQLSGQLFNTNFMK